MKFIFDRAVKGKDEDYRHVYTETFEGDGPWIKQGVKFSNAEDCFEHAKKTGRALGIRECECAILLTEDKSKKFVFSFKHEAEFMTFLIATSGDAKIRSTRNIHFNSPEECSQALPKLIKFLQQNEIFANIVGSGNPQILRVITGSRFDDFSIVHAYNQNIFASKKQDDVLPPPAP